MTTSTLGWTAKLGWRESALTTPPGPDLVLYFGSGNRLEGEPSPLQELRARFPQAMVAGCSTAGEILQSSVQDDTIVALAVTFAESRVRAELIEVAKAADSFAAAAELGRRLAEPDLKHVLILSDGLGVNGTPLTRGFQSTLPPNVSLTGGLAGDGVRFERTLVGLNAEIGTHRVVAIGFYGAKLQVGFGSGGGWEAFGPKRLVTKSEGNVLKELDGQPALALYKRYLGERATGLPATGLLFPLVLLENRDAENGLVRSILAVDEANQSLTFAGDIPEGHYVRLMKAGLNALVGGAEIAAERASPAAASHPPGFALMVSCVGRKIVMGQRIEEEVDAVLGLLGTSTPAIGFYSYGEICPAGVSNSCDLHNQTMTLTVFTEQT